MLSKNWRNEVTLRGPKNVRVETLNNEVMLRPMTAARQTAIDDQFEPAADGKLKDPRGYVLAIIADTIVGVEGEPIFTVDDLRTGLEWAVVKELSDLVSAFLEIRKSDHEKN